MHVLQPLQVNGLTLPNRLALAPMHTHLAEPTDNLCNDKHLAHYGSIALGGVGLVMVEAVSVDYGGRLYVDDMGLWSDAFVDNLRKLTDHIHQTSPAKVCVQLCHAGGKANARFNARTGLPEQLPPQHPLGAELVSSSAVGFSSSGPTLRALTAAELDDVKHKFVLAARRAVVAGFDMVELHGAHGYLLNQFSSPEINKRTDEFGGSTLDRLRFPLAVAQAVRHALPSKFPLSFRISAVDWTAGGFSKADSVIYAQELQKCGVDLVNVSTGGVTEKQMLPSTSGPYQLEFAAAVKAAVSVPVVAVGNLDDLDVVEDALRNYQCDLAAVGRRLLRDPFWPRLSVRERGSDMWTPKHQTPGWGMTARREALLSSDKEIDAVVVQGENELLESRDVAVMCRLGPVGLCAWLGSK